MTAGEELRVFTWNLNGLESARLDSRMEKACIQMVLGVTLREAMAGAPSPPLPHVFCLQEVVRRVHIDKLRHHFGAAGFTLVPAEPPEREDYSLIAVRPPWTITESAYVPFEHSKLARGYTEVQIRSDSGQEALVLTAHMESLRSGGEDRTSQTLQIDARLMAGAESLRPAIFAGDTNLREAEFVAARAEGCLLRDVFDLAKRPAAHNATWWPEGSRRGYRFDRIWLDPISTGALVDFRTRRRSKLSDHSALEACFRF
ncbi:MAG: endonuclease/exonuclease/phosphatase family protein [Polyangiales bacterium]